MAPEIKHHCKGFGTLMHITLYIIPLFALFEGESGSLDALVPLSRKRLGIDQEEIEVPRRCAVTCCFSCAACVTDSGAKPWHLAPGGLHQSCAACCRRPLNCYCSILGPTNTKFVARKAIWQSSVPMSLVLWVPRVLPPAWLLRWLVDESYWRRCWLKHRRCSPLKIAPGHRIH